MSIQRPLFARFPEIEERVALVGLAELPTPVQFIQDLGPAGLWVKRDDLTNPLYGGNKVRKLEFILGAVQAAGKTRIVTTGGLGTHHGLATTIYAGQQGLKTTLILYEQPVTPHVQENLRLLSYFGAEMVLVKGYGGVAWQFYCHQRLKYPRAFFLYAGGSIPVGALGFVNAAFELAEQVQRGEMPKPDIIFCALGSNGTLAGLHLGCRLAGLKSRVIGVRVTPSHWGPLPMATAGTAHKLALKTYKLLRQAGAKLPPPPANPPEVWDNYFGSGYGHPTEAGERAQEVFAAHDIQLEPTYTAKTATAVLDFLNSPNAKGKTVLYWHTFNSASLTQYADKVKVEDLPGDFRRFL